MTDRSAEHWYPTAAYLYVLHLDGPALAILCAESDYRRDWLRRRRRPDAAQAWGLRLLEDPAWMRATRIRPGSDHDAVVQLYPDADPPPEAHAFEFWRIPGRKQLIHDGKRLVLVSHWPGCCLRLALAPGLEDGMAYSTPPAPAHALRALSHARVRAGRIGRGHGWPRLRRGPFRPRRPRCWNCTPCRRSTRPWRARPCAKWPKGCSAPMPSPPTGTTAP
jgi:hypothetical protein